MISMNVECEHNDLCSKCHSWKYPGYLNVLKEHYGIIKEFPRKPYYYVGHFYHNLQNWFKHIITYMLLDLSDNATHFGIVIIKALS